MSKKSLNIDPKVEPASNTGSLEALMTDLVLENIFSMLLAKELKLCRLVCHKWNAISKSHLSRKTIARFGKQITREASHMNMVYTLGPDENNLKHGMEFINLLNTRDSQLGINFKNFQVRATLLPEAILGDLLLHPTMRQNIVKLDIIVYPVQLEWLKVVVEGLETLKELKVFIPARDIYCYYPGVRPPPLDYPTEDLGANRETLGIPIEYLESLKYKRVPVNLELESLDIRGYDYRSFPLWIFRRTPKLKHLTWEMKNHLHYIASFEFFNNEYRGKSLKTIQLVPHSRNYDSDAMIESRTTSFLLFLKNNCNGSVESLNLWEDTFDIWKILTSASLPRLKYLWISCTKPVDDRSFEWKLNECKTGYSVTEKASQKGATSDFLAIIPLHGFTHLKSLRVRTHIKINPNPDSRDTENNEIKEKFSVLGTIEVMTTRRFPNVTNLHIDVPCSIQDSSGQDKNCLMVSNLPHQLLIAFPSIVKLTLHSQSPFHLNLLFQTIHPTLKFLKISCVEFCGTIVTPKNFLQNNALLRMSELREFSFTTTSYSLTDRLAFKGFLKLPKLHILRFPYSSRGKLKFRSKALSKLNDKLDILESVAIGIYERAIEVGELPPEPGICYFEGKIADKDVDNFMVDIFIQSEKLFLSRIKYSVQTETFCTLIWRSCRYCGLAIIRYKMDIDIGYVVINMQPAPDLKSTTENEFKRNIRRAAPGVANRLGLGFWI